jgi:signal transduction histidine kinase/DNA-binding response OmpR family regulator
MKKSTIVTIILSLLTGLALMAAIALQNYFVIHRFNENVQHTEKTVRFLITAYGQGLGRVEEHAHDRENLIRAFLNALKTEIANIGVLNSQLFLEPQKKNKSALNNSFATREAELPETLIRILTEELKISDEDYRLTCLLPEAELFAQSWRSVLLFIGVSLLLFVAIITIMSFFGASLLLAPILPEKHRFTPKNLIFSPLKLIKAVSAIKNYQQMLEKQVRNRTAELEEKNHILTVARQESEAASQAKSRFLATMSHEIRTPMNAILCMADIALDCRPEPVIKDYLETILGAGRHLLAVLNDILDISKIEAGKFTLDKDDFSLPELVRSTIKTMEFSARSKGLQLIYTLEPELPSFVNGDPVRLRQILVNLLSNSIKFTDSGRISMEVCSGKNDDNNIDYIQLFFTVSDTGAGFSSELADKLFESFEQGESFITRKYGGTGLGLSICKKLVELMNGEISAESTPGQGSVFRFNIRVRLPEKAVCENTDHHSKNKSRKKLDILLVEDEALNIKVAKLYLEKMGHHCDVATKAEIAFQLLTGKKYDIILMDVEMPEMNGIEATRLLRTGKRPMIDPETPVISMTAHATTDIREACFAAGADAYLTKPISYEALFNALEEFGSGVVKHKKNCIIPTVCEKKTGYCLAPEAEVLKRVAIDARTYHNLLNVFYNDGQQKIKLLQKAATDNNREVIRTTAHSLKSSSWLIGADRLREIAIELEGICAADKNSTEINPLLHNFIAEMQGIIKQIASLNINAA